MFTHIVAGLLLGSSPTAEGPAAGPAEAHRVQIDHRGHSVDVVYRGSTTVAHRQQGAAGAPGRPHTLRCAWRASVEVHREARSAAGHVMSRRIVADEALTGARPGWCAAQRGAIAADVAARSGKVRDHLLAVARDDHATLVAELDAAHGSPTKS
jgi:hypothetical protein